jgi:hypothetical protein
MKQEPTDQEGEVEFIAIPIVEVSELFGISEPLTLEELEKKYPRK